MPSVAQKEATKRWRELNKERYDETKRVYMKDYVKSHYNDTEKERKRKYYIFKKEAEKLRMILIEF